MENKEIKAEGKLSVGGVTLVPVVESACAGWQFGETVSVSGYKRPLVIIVLAAGLKKAYRITGEELTTDELVKEFPSVKAAIDSL
jgi:hypothetical protein